ncbi:MAG: tetratricopeptide repeat protein, partial [Bacteroidales bacterium]|nr:tetratricopeptide repeat protein [Bacteroidales bacterium]
MQIAELTAHPERLNADTLYGLRQIVARYPYYQAA